MHVLSSSVLFANLDQPRVQVACLPPAMGGLGLPDMRTLALVQRLSSLTDGVTCP